MTIARTLAALASLAMMGLPGGVASSPSTTTDPYVSLDKIFLHSDAGWVDATAQASNRVPLDVPMATTGAVGRHAALIGNNAIFDTLRIQVGLAGIGGELIWHYWDGDSFEPLTLDSPANLDAPGDAIVSFTVPGDWAPNTSWSMCAQGYYYVKVTTNDPYDVIPIADQIWTPGNPPVAGGGGGLKPSGTSVVFYQGADRQGSRVPHDPARAVFRGTIVGPRSLASGRARLTRKPPQRIRRHPHMDGISLAGACTSPD